MKNDGSKKEKTSASFVLKGYLRRKAVRIYIGGPDTPLPESSLDNLIKNEKFPLPILSPQEFRFGRFLRLMSGCRIAEIPKCSD